MLYQIWAISSSTLIGEDTLWTFESLWPLVTVSWPLLIGFNPCPFFAQLDHIFLWVQQNNTNTEAIKKISDGCCCSKNLLQKSNRGLLAPIFFTCWWNLAGTSKIYWHCSECHKNQRKRLLQENNRFWCKQFIPFLYSKRNANWKVSSEREEGWIQETDCIFKARDSMDWVLDIRNRS